MITLCDHPDEHWPRLTIMASAPVILHNRTGSSGSWIAIAGDRYGCAAEYRGGRLGGRLAAILRQGARTLLSSVSIPATKQVQ